MYFLTCACVDLYAALLARLPDTAALPLRALHGRMKQAAREAVLADFTDLPAGMPLHTTLWCFRHCGCRVFHQLVHHSDTTTPSLPFLHHCGYQALLRECTGLDVDHPACSAYY